MTVAPPAMPAYVAIQPAWRPMTSTTITRSWLSAVVWSRSMASVAICTAVWKPNVTSVPSMSLSIVLGTPTTGGRVCSQSMCGDGERAVAADDDQGVEAQLLERGLHERQAVGVLERAAAAGAEHVPPRGSMPAQRPRRRAASWSRVMHAVPGVEEPEDLVAVDRLALADDGPDDGVQPGQSPPPVSTPTRMRTTVRVMAWDSTRRVPWKRVLMPFALYAVVALVLFTILDKGFDPASSSGVAAGGVIYPSSPSSW